MSGVDVAFSSGNIIDQLCNNVNSLNYTVCQLCKQIGALQSTFTTPPVAEIYLPSPTSFSLPAIVELSEYYEETNTSPADKPKTGEWVIRTLNHQEENSSPTNIQLNYNIITFPIGIFELFIRCPATNTGEHQIQLYNADTNEVEAYGSSAQAYNTTNDSILLRTLAITSPTNYVIRHVTSQSQNASFGVPGNHGSPEIYTQMRVRAFVV